MPEKSTFQKIQSIFGYDNYEKKMEKNITVAAKYYFPKWRHFVVNGYEFTGVDMIRNVEMLCEGLMKNVMLCCKKWRSENDCKAFLGKVIHVIVHFNNKLLSFVLQRAFAVRSLCIHH